MAQLMLVNPRKRRATKRRKTTAVARRKSPIRRRASTVARKVRRYRRNPIRTAGVMGQVQNAAIGAAGALAVDVAMQKLPLPANMTATPTMRAASQGIVSLGIGMLVAKFGKKRKLGQQLAEGGLTVALHGMGKGLIGPSIGLNGYEEGLLGGDLLGYEDFNDDLGWTSPATVDSWDSDLSGYEEF